MAKRKKKTGTVAGTVIQKTEQPAQELPEGYTAVNPVAGAGAWYSPESGEIVEGELLGRFASRSKFGGFYYQIRTIRSARAMVRNEEGDYQLEEIEAGQIVNVDEKHALKQFESLTLKGRWMVYLQATEKIELDGGTSPWQFVVGKRAMEDDEDVPF